MADLPRMGLTTLDIGRNRPNEKLIAQTTQLLGVEIDESDLRSVKAHLEALKPIFTVATTHPGYLPDSTYAALRDEVSKLRGIVNSQIDDIALPEERY